MKNPHLIILIILFILIAVQTFGQSRQVKDHAKLQREMSYEARIKSNTAFTMSSAKYAFKQAKNRQKQTAKRERYYNRVEAIRTKTAKL